MSNLINQNWIGFDGKPVTGRVPPNIRLMAGQMTPTVMAEVAHRYQLFCMGKQTAVGNYFVSDKTLPGGGRVRIVSVQGVDTVFVWAPSSEDLDLMVAGGFACRPTSNILGKLTTPEFWGKPFTEALEPLGTPGGDDPFVLLTPTWKKVGGVASPTHEYKRVRGLSDNYGPIDWQGPNHKTDVLSWDASGWSHITFDSYGNPARVYMKWQNATSSPNDPQKAANVVPRYKCFGTGKKIYSNMAVLRTMVSAGVVEGAAKIGRDLIVAMRNNNDFTFYRVPSGGGTEEPLGTYTMPAQTLNTQGWYFSKSGTKARCVFASKNAQYAIEASIGSSAVTFTEVSESRGDALSGTFYYAEAVLTITIDETVQAEPYHLTRDTTKTGSVRNVSGAKTARSPAMGADFFDEVPTLAYVRWAVTNEASSSGSLSVHYERGGSWWNSDATLSHTLTPPLIEAKLVMSAAGQEAIVPLGEVGLQPQTVTCTGSESLSMETVIDPIVGAMYQKSGSINSVLSSISTLAQDRAKFGAPLDFDARLGAALIFKVCNKTPAGSTTTSGGHSALEGTGSGSPPHDVTRTSSGSSSIEDVMVQTWRGESEASQSAPRYNITYPESSTELSVAAGNLDIFNVDGALLEDGNPHVRLHRRWNIGMPSLAQLRTSMWGAGYNDAHGVLRSYYGNVLSTSVVEAGGAIDGPSAENPDAPIPANMAAIHIIGPADKNGAKLVHIEDKPIPWLFRLGVV